MFAIEITFVRPSLTDNTFKKVIVSPDQKYDIVKKYEKLGYVGAGWRKIDLAPDDERFYA